MLSVVHFVGVVQNEMADSAASNVTYVQHATTLLFGSQAIQQL